MQGFENTFFQIRYAFPKFLHCSSYMKYVIPICKLNVVYYI
jgi:hypothetical protein